MSTSSADPADLQTFVTTATNALTDLKNVRDAAVRLMSAFPQYGSIGISDGGAGAALAQFVADGDLLDSSVVAIRTAFLTADSGPGTHRLDDAVIGAGLRAAGVGIPTEAPATVETPTIVGPPVDSGVADDPVNLANGNFFEVETDLPMPGRAVAAAWVRTYSSRRHAQAGALGRGWSCWADCLLSAGPAEMRLLRPDGAELTFPAPADDARVALPDGTGTVERDGDGHLLRVPGSREQWRFDAAGRPVEVVVGPVLARLSWPAGRLATVEHPASGRSVALRWSEDGSRLTGASTSDGREVRYRYDGAGDLLTVERPAGMRRYEIADGLIGAVTDADGIIEVRNTYDESGRVLTQRSPEGRLSRYVYRPGLQAVVTDDEGSAFNAYQHDTAGRLVAVTDDTGGTTRREFGADGRLTAVVQPGGGRIGQELDPDGRALSVTDAAGASYGASYDAQGRMTELVDRTGRWRRHAFQGSLRTPVTVTDAAGTTRLEVSAADLITAVTDPDGVRTTYAWTPDAQLAAFGTAAGTTRFGYDDAGHLLWVEAPDGVFASWEVDAAGRVVAETDPRGGRMLLELSPAGRVLAVTDPGGGRYVTSWGAHGNVATVTDPLGSVLGFGYDSHGNTTAMTAPDGRTFGFDHDGLGRLTTVTTPSGATTGREYGADGAVVAEVTATGARITADHDAVGRRTRITSAVGEHAERTYDAEGRVLSETAADGGRTTFGYDDAGRLVRTTDPRGAETTYSWSPGGRLREVVSALGHRTGYTDDAAGRPESVRWPDGAVSRVERDGLGRVVRQIQDDGQVATTAYDGLGAVIGSDDGAGRTTEVTRNWLGQPLEERVGAETWRYVWDVRGALVAASDPAGARSSFRYDECGRLAAAVGPLGGEWVFGYDTDGRPARVTDAAGRTSKVERDADGQLIAAIEADGSGIRVWRDAAARVVGVGAADADMPTDTYVLDGVGRIVTATGLEGETTMTYVGDDVATLRGPSGALTWEYDAESRLAAITTGDGARATVERDAAGDVLSVAGRRPGGEPAARWTVERDAAGRLSSAVRDGDDPSVALSWRWDAGGRLVAEAGPAGTHAYGYDDAGQLVTAGDDTGQTTYAYDGAGRRTSEERDDGARTDYRWDARGRLVEVSRTAADGAMAPTALRYDAYGLLCRVGDRRIVCDPNAPGAPVRVVDGEIVLTVGGRTVLVGPDGSTRPAPAQARDPFGLVLAGTSVFGPRGELDVGGLLAMGERWLDPSTRAFLSPDPLPAVAGRPGLDNPYSFAWDDPTRFADPDGLRPLTLDALHAQWDSKARGSLGNAWETIKKDPLGTLGAVAVIATGAVLMAVPGMQTVGAGMLVGAGSALVVGLATGTFNPRAVMMAGIVGGVSFGATSLASGAVSGTLATAAVGATAGGVAGAAGSLATSAVLGEPVTPLSVFAGAAGGAVGGGFGALAGPAGGSAVKTFLGQDASTVVGSSSRPLATAAVKYGTYTAVNATGGALASSTAAVVQGDPITGRTVFFGAAGGVVGGLGGDAVGDRVNENSSGMMRTLKQTDAMGGQSYGSAVTAPGARASSVLSAAGVGGLAGSGSDIAKGASDQGPDGG